MHRVRFEPIDVKDVDDFTDLYNLLKKCMNTLYRNEHNEIMPSIRKIYPVDDMGFPLDPEA